MGRAFRGRPVAGVLGLIAILLVGVGLWWLNDATGRGIDADGAPQIDMAGNRVRVASVDSRPSVDEIQAMEATPDAGGRFVVPSVGLDVPLGELSEVDGQITPPEFTAVYRVRNRGVHPASADAGTVFVVTHSLTGGGIAPGNYLADVDSGAPSVEVGATIVADGETYRVVSNELVGKTDLPARADIWSDTPNRLVVITCMQRATGRSVQNLVITAVRVPV